MKGHEIAAGVAAALVVVAVIAWPSRAPAPAPPVGPPPDLGMAAPEETPRAPAPAPLAPPAPAPEAPAPQEAEEQLAPGPEDAAVHAQWQERLAREDELLVGQAIQAGCDAQRAEAMRAALAAKRAARARTIEDLEAGRISREEMAARARETKRQADEALRKILTPQELEALDPEGARAAVVEADHKESR